MILRRTLYSQLLGTALYGSDGIRVGQVRRVLVDEITGRPEWIAVSTGVLGARQRLVSIMAADLEMGGIRVPYPAAVVLAAPRFDPRDPAPDQDTGEALYRHYGMDSEPPPLGSPGSTRQDVVDGDDLPSPTVRTSDRTPIKALAQWDLAKVRQLVELVLSYPQQPLAPSVENLTVTSARPSIASTDENDPQRG